MSFPGLADAFRSRKLGEPAKVTLIILHRVGTMAGLERQVVAEALEPEGAEVVRHLPARMRSTSSEGETEDFRGFRQEPGLLCRVDRAIGKERLPHLLDEGEPALASTSPLRRCPSR